MKELYNSFAVNRAIRYLADQVIQDTHLYYKDRDPKPILLLPILDGGLYLFGRLIPLLAEAGLVFDYESISREKSTLKGSYDNQLIYLVDDILDTGRTSREIVSSLLISYSIEQLRALFLIERVRSERQATLIPHYSGIHHIGGEWFYGCGMDLHDRCRGLDSIYYRF